MGSHAPPGTVVLPLHPPLVRRTPSRVGGFSGVGQGRGSSVGQDRERGRHHPTSTEWADTRWTLDTRSATGGVEIK